MEWNYILKYSKFRDFKKSHLTKCYIFIFSSNLLYINKCSNENLSVVKTKTEMIFFHSLQLYTVYIYIYIYIKCFNRDQKL